jgi:hypothetical protein
MYSNITYQYHTLFSHDYTQYLDDRRDTERERERETSGELNRKQEEGFRWMLNNIPADGCRFCRSTLSLKTNNRKRWTYSKGVEMFPLNR